MLVFKKSDGLVMINYEVLVVQCKYLYNLHHIKMAANKILSG